MKNGNGNGNNLALRITKLEAGFNLLIDLLSEKSGRLLFSSHTPALNRLLATYAEGKMSATTMLRLCQTLRRIEGDRQETREVRLLCGLLLVAIELRHSVQGR